MFFNSMIGVFPIGKVHPLCGKIRCVKAGTTIKMIHGTKRKRSRAVPIALRKGFFTIKHDCGNEARLTVRECRQPAPSPPAPYKRRKSRHPSQDAARTFASRRIRCKRNESNIVVKPSFVNI